jgi:carboxyl-terminal processing protease
MRARLAAILAAFFALSLPAGAELFDSKLEPFLDALDDMQTRYVDETKVTTPKLTENAMKGIVDALDPESLLIDPAKPMGTANPGISIAVKDGAVYAFDVAEGSAAEAAGLRAGDRILRVDGKGVSGKKRLDVEAVLRGAPGSRAMLIWADSRSGYRELSLTRSPIGKPAWRSVRLDSVEVVQVFRLDAGSAKEISAWLMKLDPAAVSGALLDMRLCHMGDPDAGIALADSCLAGKELIATGAGVNPKYSREYVAKKKDKWVRIPLVVVMGPWTAGAAEIFAGALQAHHRCILAGEKSFGYAARQQDFPVNDGRTLRITVERFSTPLSRSITGRGLEPDLAVEPAIPGKTALYLEDHRVAEKFAERILKDTPAEYDTEALKRGEIRLSAAELKDRSVAEQRNEFETTFQISLEAMLRDLELEVDREDLEENRAMLISRVRVLLARRLMKPMDALLVALREDPAIKMGADSIGALERLSGREKKQ